MNIWSKLDRADKMGALSALATFMVWFFMKGKRYV